MSGRRGLLALALAASVVLLPAGCSARDRAAAAAGTPGVRVSGEAATGADGSLTGADRVGPDPVAVGNRPALIPIPAPTRVFAVGTRELALNRGGQRPLPTTAWYPAEAAGAGTALAAGRFPLMLLSHGLMGKPEQQFAAIGTRLAAAGFVVVAPAYPFTKPGPNFNRGDVTNQPLDAAHVITEVLSLSGHSGDPFAGHLDSARVGAGGFSAGGKTTAGMLSAGKRDARLRAAVIIAGGPLGAFTGPATPVLCVHGDADDVVKYSTGRAAYDRLPWSKAFLTVLGKGHGSYLQPGNGGFEQVFAAMVEFLRWTLYGDSSAKARLSALATLAGVTRFESQL